MKYKPKYEINEKIRTNLREIERLKDKVRGSRILPEAEASIRARASVEAAHSSTAIEGNPLSMSQVRAVIGTEKILTKDEYAEIEVRNYKKALDFIAERRTESNKMELAEVLELHGIIMERLLGAERCGKIRKNPVYVVNQRDEVLYTAPESKDVEILLTELLDWVAENQFAAHPAIIAAMIHFRMAAIHPFADGNGRTARASTALFLARNQYDCDGALVLDSYYAEDKQAYYRVLQRVNGKNYASSAKTDLTPWIEYFTDGFLTSLRVLDAEIRLLNLATAGVATQRLSRDDQDILSYASKFGALGISEAEEILPHLSRRSLQRRLRGLVEAGYLELVGESRDARYELKP